MTAKKKPARRRTVRKWTPEPIRNVGEIMRGFPEPGPGPRAEQINADSREEIIDLEWRFYAHHAVHSNDPTIRQQLSGLIIRFLVSGEPLGIGAREWLIFVLKTLQGEDRRTLQRKDRFPRLAKGRPVDSAKALVERLKLRAYLLAHVDESVTRALEGAAQHMNHSFDHVRKMFYSSVFWLSRHEVADARKAGKKRKVSR